MMMVVGIKRCGNCFKLRHNVYMYAVIYMTKQKQISYGLAKITLCKSEAQKLLQ